MLIWLQQYLSKNNTARNFIFVFLLMCGFYRGYFYHFYSPMNYNSESFMKHFDGLVYVGLGLAEDIGIALLIAAIIVTIQYLFRKSSLPSLQFFAKILVSLLLIFFALDFIAYTKVFLILHTAATWHLFNIGLHQGSFSQNFLTYMNYQNWLCVITPVLLFIVLENFTPYRITVWLNRFLISIMVCVAATSAYFYAPDVSARIFFGEIFNNPVAYLISPFKTDSYYATQNDKPELTQMTSVALIDPAFVNKNSIVIQPAAKPKKDWNIVFYVLESVSSSYVFNAPLTSFKTPPMPFFKKISEEGLWLNNNYAPGNSSTLAEFGLFTSLYPSPMPDNFEMQAKVYVPSILDWLGRDKYDSLIVMATNSYAYFGRNLLTSFGFKKIFDFYDIAHIPVRSMAIEQETPLNERPALNYFIDKLQGLTPPFLAVYWSNANHAPYKDSADTNLNCDTKDPSCIYTKNLLIVDDGLARVFAYLKSANLLDSTIVVVVADHGEGFGRNYLDHYHGDYLYEDQIRTPVLFWQPALFKPQVVSELTNTIDIIPTLLTAMGISYDSNFLQGEVISDKPTQRKYTFTYGIEDELAAIDKNKMKVIISFQDGQCSFYDLNVDPYELSPHNCRNDAREKTLIKFRNFQHAILENYNHTLAIKGVNSLASA